MISITSIEQVRKLTDEFSHKYYEYLGTVYDCAFGLNTLIKYSEEILNLKKNDIINKNYDNMHEDTKVFCFATDIKNLDTVHYVSSSVDICRRIITNHDDTFLSKMFIVYIFQLWETYYREKIAEILQLNITDIKVPILGDLAKIRNSIIHNNSIATKDIDKCEVIKQFKYKDEIIINSEMLWKIKSDLSESLNRFVLELNSELKN